MKFRIYFWNIVGVITGAVAVGFGIVMIHGYATSLHAAGPIIWNTANGVSNLYYAATQFYEVMVNAIGTLFILLGVVDICVFLCRLARLEEDEDSDGDEK